MRVQIVQRHCEVPEKVRDRARVRVERLTKFHPRLASAEVIFEEEKHERRVEGILAIDGDQPVVAKAEGETFRAALDRLEDRLGRMLKDRRTRDVDHQGARPDEA